MREQTRSILFTDGPRDAPRLTPIATLVLWVGCLAVGVAGWLLPYRRPGVSAVPAVPVQVEVVNVAITPDLPSLPADAAAAADPAPSTDALIKPSPLPAEAAIALAAAPPMTALAVPSPAIAFALPVDRPAVTGQSAIGEPSASKAAGTPAAHDARPAAVAGAPGAVRRLTFGEGEGRQPAPEYPREARLARQQGTVIVRFTVGEDGRVLTAVVAEPCPSPLLNQAAARAVRETWQFAAGPARTYEVPIQFELRRR